MDTFEYLPASYHIRNCDNPQVQKMKKDLEDAVSDVVLLSSLSSQIWIVKPAESSNRGRGIIVCQGLEQTLSEIYHRFEPEVTKQQP